MLNMKKKLDAKNLKLKEMYKSKADLQESIKNLQLIIKNSIPKSTVVKKLFKIFTPKQVDLILNPGRSRVAWTQEDISSALTAHNYGHRAYEYWRNVQNLPFPALSTMRKWISDIIFDEGIYNH